MSEELTDEQEAARAATDFYTRYQALDRLRREAWSKNIKVLLPELKRLNVTQVVMSYYGGGDSGEYHYPVYTVEQGDKSINLESRAGYGGSSYSFDNEGEFSSDVEVIVEHVHYGDWDPETSTQGMPYTSTETKNLCKAIYDLMEYAVEQQHGGWYNNEGGEGTVTFDVTEGRIDVEHGDYVTHTEWDHYSFSVEE